MAWAKLAFGEFVNIQAGSNFAAFAGNLAGRGTYRLEIILATEFDTSANWVFGGRLGNNFEICTAEQKVTTRSAASRSCLLQGRAGAFRICRG